MRRPALSALRSTFFVLGAAAAILAAAAPAAAVAPPQLPVQGWLADPSGTPVDGEREMTFELYDAESAGTVLHAEQQAAVTVTRGLFTAYLGTGQSLGDGGVASLDLGRFVTRDAVWVQVTVGTEVMTPRFRLATAPFAGWANFCGDTARLDDLAAADLALVTHQTPWSSITDVPPAIADGVDNDVLGGLTSCPAGGMAKRVGTAWQCGTDYNTTYTAGGGVTLAGTSFAIATDGVDGARLANNLSYQSDLTISGGTPPLRIRSGAAQLDITDTSITSNQALVLQGLGASVDVSLNGQLRQCDAANCAPAADPMIYGELATATNGTVLGSRLTEFWVCVPAGYDFGDADMAEGNSTDDMLYAVTAEMVWVGGERWMSSSRLRTSSSEEATSTGLLCFARHLAHLGTWW